MNIMYNPILIAITQSRQLELQTSGGKWYSCTHEDALSHIVSDRRPEHLRVQPEYVCIDDVNLVAPLRAPPLEDTIYWTFDLHTQGATDVLWGDDDYDRARLNAGLVFATHQAASAVHSALRNLLAPEGDQK